MYQQPGDPNQPNQGPYSSPNNPQWPNNTPAYPPAGYPPSTDQPSYVPPPPTYYPPDAGAPTYPPTQPGASPYGYQQPTYPSGPNYPQQQWPGNVPPQQPRKSRTRLIAIVGAALALVIVLSIVAVALAHQGTANTSPTPTPAAGTTPVTGTTPSTSGNTPTTSAVTPTSQTSTSGAQVGQTVQAGANYAVTVNSAKTSTGDSVFQPKSGNIYLVIDVTVKNTSASSQDVSSFINFELQDSTGQKYQEAFTDIGTPPDQTGLQPGKLIRGQLVYEVPQSMHQFSMTFTDLLGDGSLASWNLSD